MATKLLAALALTLIIGCGKDTKDKTGEMIPETTMFTVTSDNAPNSYTVNGKENGSITMRRGTTYTFNVDARNHPFFIFYAIGGNPANAYTNGVSGNGVQ